MLDVLGHQGGWDEILMVVAPLLILAGLLLLANKRAKAALEAEEADNGSPMVDKPSGGTGG